MKKASREGRMRQFRGEVRNEWQALLPVGEDPISYLLKKDIPLYLEVDQMRHLVHRTSKVEFPPMDEGQKKLLEEISWESASSEDLDAIQLQASNLTDGIAFLRLDTASIEKLGHAEVCTSPNFMGWGLAPARTYRVTGQDLRGRPVRKEEKIEAVRDLVKVELECAAIVDKEEWEKANRRGEPGIRADDHRFRASVTVSVSELFLDVLDIEKLKQEKIDLLGLVAYPFEHQERAPGIYWMFQAAYRLNGLQAIVGGNTGVGPWLKQHAAKAFRYRADRTAEKFVWMTVGRDQGGGKRGEFKIGQIDELHGGGAYSRYKFDFTSDGLALILAIADFWFELKDRELSVSRVVLAEKLMAHGFGGMEVGDLVYLIDGERLDKDDVSGLEESVRKRGGNCVLYVRNLG